MNIVPLPQVMKPIFVVVYHSIYEGKINLRAIPERNLPPNSKLIKRSIQNRTKFLLKSFIIKINISKNAFRNFP